MGVRSNNHINRAFQYRPAKVPRLVLRGVWLTLAMLCLALGIYLFVAIGFTGNDANPFLGYIAFGAMCCAPIIGTIFMMIWDNSREGYIDGSNEYTTTVTVTEYSATATTTNHPIRGFLLGLLGGIIGSLLIGPLLLVVFIVVKSIFFVRNIIDLAKGNVVP